MKSRLSVMFALAALLAATALPALAQTTASAPAKSAAKTAWIDAGTGIAKDCEADPHGLLYAIVDKHVRRVIEGAAR